MNLFSNFNYFATIFVLHKRINVSKQKKNPIFSFTTYQTFELQKKMYSEAVKNLTLFKKKKSGGEVNSESTWLVLELLY